MTEMKTHLEIDDQLLAEAMRRGGHGTKRSAIHAALQEYVRMRKQLDLLALKGKVRWVGDLEQMRRNRSS
jgi:Arc/MetJ family transcription regulator